MHCKLPLQYKTDPELSSPIPSGLAHLIEKTKSVSRYKDPRYPEGMISDILYGHLIRLLALAEQLGLEEPLKEDVIKTIWLHDLPEVLLGDQPAVLVNDGLMKKQEEASVAKALLTSSDYRLYDLCEVSYDFLKGKGDKYNACGLIVKLLDAIDGNLYFLTKVRDWVKSGHAELPPDTAFIYTFKQYDSYMKRIESIKEIKLKKYLSDLLDWEIYQVQLIWKDTASQTPEVIKAYLRNH